MNFASPYIYDDVAEESYEVVSDEEFNDGMDLSDSSGSDDEPEVRERSLGAGGSRRSQTQTDSASTTEAQGDVADGSSSAAKPSMLNRVMGMLSSSGSRRAAPHSHSEPGSPPPPPPPPRKSKSSRAHHHWKSTARSSDSGSRGRTFRRADTNIVSLRFDTLKKPSTMHAGEVIQCAGCEVIMSFISTIEEVGPQKVWKCEFCGHRNEDVEEEEKPTADDVTYLIEPALSTTSSGISGRDESIVVFCIDISGSMTITTEVPGHQRLRGSATLRRLRRENTMEGPQHLPHEGRNVTYISRLQAVQAAVDHQLGEMAREFPHRRVALVTFSSEVCVIGDGTGDEVWVAGQKLMDKEKLTNVGSELPMPKAIKDVRTSLGEKIFALEEGGSTALGPAIVVALSLASRQPGSKVILCTDGKSNEGVGKVENLQESDAAPDEFYDDVASTANNKGVSMSVITISGTDCKLIQLGKLASSTGGQVNIVNPLKLTEEFSNVLADRIIATSVVATFLVHKDLYIGKEENAACKERREIGNVNSDHEISFEFGLRRKKAKEQPPKPAPLDCIAEVSLSVEERAANSLPSGTSGMGDDTASGGSSATTPTPPTPTPQTADATAPAEAQGDANTCTGGASPGEKKKDGSEDTPAELPFQVQITYTDVDGTKALRVLTQKKPVTRDRNVAERDVDLNMLALHTERRSSELALQGDYSGSRGVALMNQRLGWRSSHNSSDESKRRLYRQVFSRVKTVENSVSHRQQQERVTYGRTHSDDEDEVDESHEDTKDLMDSADMLPQAAQAPQASNIDQGAGRSRRSLKKMKMRSEEVDDGLAKILYTGYSVGHSSHSKSDDKDKDKDKDKSSKK